MWVLSLLPLRERFKKYFSDNIIGTLWRNGLREVIKSILIIIWTFTHCVSKPFCWQTSCCCRWRVPSTTIAWRSASRWWLCVWLEDIDNSRIRRNPSLNRKATFDRQGEVPSNCPELTPPCPSYPWQVGFLSPSVMILAWSPTPGKGRATSLSVCVNWGPLKGRHHKGTKPARELLEGTHLKNKMEEADVGKENL